MAEIEQRHKNAIGTQVLYRRRGRRGKNNEKKVTILGVRFASTTVVNLETEEETEGIQFLMEPLDGGRNFWSDAFPNKDI